MIIVDSHEDLAMNMLQYNRDYLRSVQENREREADTPIIQQNGTIMLGWPEWVEGNVAVLFGTLFASPIRHSKGDWVSMAYADQNEAHTLYMQQLEHYRRWTDDASEKIRLIGNKADLNDVLARWQPGKPEQKPLVGIVPLMEGADAIRQPEEVSLWFERGVRIVGLAWAGTVYSGGTREPGPLTPAGYALLDIMADIGMALDLSHMSDEATMQALDHFEGVLMASHSNPRALAINPEVPDRHLSDTAIEQIAARDGVIGSVPYNRFLRGDWKRSEGRQEFSIKRVAENIDYICQLVGSAAHVGIGTDFDGGLGLEDVPRELDSVADLQLIGDELKDYGYDPEDVNAIMGGNFIRLLQRSLPED